MIEELIALGIDLRGKTKDQVATTCPWCSHDRKKKNDRCLSVNIDQGVYNCHHCGKKGTVGRGNNEFTTRMSYEKESYVPLEPRHEHLSPNHIEYLVNERKLSHATIQRFKIYSDDDFIAFPYYQDDNLWYIKYRSLDKQFRSEKGGKPILFGLHLELDHSRPLIVTEGEIDAMSFYEVGFTNVVSVPTGAKGLTWLSRNLEFLDPFEQIWIAYDNDAPGIESSAELARRIGIERCYKFYYPSDIKDANEILQRKETLEEAKEVFQLMKEHVVQYEPKGIVSTDAILRQIEDYFITGDEKGESTGFLKLDQHMRLYGGMLYVITGIPSHGKSTFVDNIMANSSSPWLVFSPEMQPCFKHVIKLSTIKTGVPIARADDIAIETVLQQFAFCDVDEVRSLDGLIELTVQAVRRYGVKGVLIDPWSQIEHHEGKESETNYIRRVLSTLQSLAKKYDLFMFLVAHPTKMKKLGNGDYEVPNLYDIAGSAHFFNHADFGITVYREFESNNTSIFIQKVRFEHTGKRGVVDLSWDPRNKRYSEVGGFSYGQ